MLKSLPTALSVASLLALAACSGSDDKSEPTELATLNGTVLNAPNPVGGVQVTVSGAGGTFETTTSSVGTYSFSGIPAGEYTLDFCGVGVFDSNGNPIADKINLHLPASRVAAGSSEQKPAFLPEKATGLTVDTAGTNMGMIPAGTVVVNAAAGVAVIFAEETTVTFVDPADTTISITRVPTEQIPVALPEGLAAKTLVAIEPAGAVFDVRPQITFLNGTGLPIGTQGVSIYRLNYSNATWVSSGTGTVSATGDTILSDDGEGLRGTGWHALVAETFCDTTVTGRVVDGSNGSPVVGALVTALNGLTTETNSSGEYVFESVPLPGINFDVVVTVVPPAGAGFLPDETSSVTGMCGSETEMGTLALTPIAVDTTAPTVSATVPAADAVDVADNAAISVTFDEIMSPGSLSASHITLRAGAQLVDGQIGVATNGGQTTATFVPNEALALSTTFRLEISAEVMDAAGNRLGAAQSIPFTTASDAGGGTPSLTVTPSTPAAILPGSTLDLSAAVQDAAGSTVEGAQVVWSSDTPAIMTVDATGTVTAFAPGTATIRASFGGVFDEVPVTVNTPAIDDVVLTGEAPVIVIGSSIALSAVAQDSGDVDLQGFSFNWTSSDDAVASVDAGGTVRALTAGGPVTITATEPGSGLNASFALTVLDPSTVASVEVSASTGSIGPDAAVQVTAVALTSNEDDMPGVTFTFASSDTNVAAVSASGLVTAVGSGSVQITATANGSQQVSGSVDLDVFPYEPTVVRLLNDRADPSPILGTLVVLSDAVTGQVMDGEVTDSNGFADFGFTDSERITVTYVYGDSGQSDGSLGLDETYVFTAVDVPAGRMTLTLQGPSEFSFGVDASFPTGADTLVGSIGGRVSSELGFEFGAMSPVEMFVPAREYEGTGVLVASFDSSSGSAGIVAGGFTEVAGNEGASASVTLTPEAVSTVPFSASSEVVYAGSRFLRSGLLYGQDSGVTLATDLGAMAFVAPDATERYAHRFESMNPLTFATVGREMRSSTVPASMSVGLPQVNVSGVSYDAQTRTLSWSAGGSGAGAFDMGRAFVEAEPVSLGIPGGGEGVLWEVVFPATATSVVLPDGKGFPFLSVESLTFGVELFDQAGVANYDAFLSSFRAQDGNFEQATMSGGNRLDYVRSEMSQFDFSISNGSLGVVSYDLGEGLVTVADGDLVALPMGTSVQITAEGNPGTVVTSLNSNQGEATGVGTGSATLTIEDNGGATFVTVSFSAP